MVTVQTIIILFIIGLTSCNSPVKSPKQITVIDTANISQINRDSSKNLVNTIVSSNFQGDTVQQIDKTLQLVADFDKSSSNFRKDTFSVYEKTTEGCEIIVVNDSTTDLEEFYGTLYGEMGKREFKFYLLNGRKPKFSCAVFKDIFYDKPISEKDMQIRDTKMSYQIYNNNKLIAILDEEKRKQNVSAKKLKAAEDDARRFFKDYIGQIKI